MSKLEDTISDIEGYKNNEKEKKRLYEQWKKDDFEWKKSQKKLDNEYRRELWECNKDMAKASLRLAGSTAKSIGKYLLEGMMVLSAAAVIAGSIYGLNRCSNYLSSDGNIISAKKSYAVEETVSKNEDDTLIENIVYENEPKEKTSEEKLKYWIETEYITKKVHYYDPETNVVMYTEEEKRPVENYVIKVRQGDTLNGLVDDFLREYDIHLQNYELKKVTDEIARYNLDLGRSQSNSRFKLGNEISFPKEMVPFLKDVVDEYR